MSTGQPIRLKLLPPRRRNNYDSDPNAGRPLSERISRRGERNRSRSPARNMQDEAARRNIDRYVPGGRRSRSPIRNRGREGGRRPGARRGGANGTGREDGERPARDGRPKKTQEELDAEMEDYFTNQASAAQATAGQTAEEDIDMIE